MKYQERQISVVLQSFCRNSCYLNCVHKPITFKESLAKAINYKPNKNILSINEIVDKLNKGIKRSINI